MKDKNNLGKYKVLKNKVQGNDKQQERRAECTWGVVVRKDIYPSINEKTKPQSKNGARDSNRHSKQDTSG